LDSKREDGACNRPGRKDRSALRKGGKREISSICMKVETQEEELAAFLENGEYKGA